MANVPAKYLKDENGNIISPITCVESVTNPSNHGGELLSNTLLTYHNSEMSTGEVWIDGKIIYRNVVPINFGNPNITRVVDETNGVVAAFYQHNINSIDFIVEQRLVWYDSDDGGWFENMKNSELNFRYFVILDFVGKQNLKVLYGPTNYLSTWSSRISKMNLIVKYTKN